VYRALRSPLRRGWRADVHWRAAGGEINHTSVSLHTLPEPFSVFAHPDVAEGQPRRITALNIDERQRRLRLDLASNSQRRAIPKS
jgi:hypothetical protein